MRSCWIREMLEPMTGILIGRRKYGQTHSERRTPCKDVDHTDAGESTR
jgi:hypothetical protein